MKKKSKVYKIAICIVILIALCVGCRVVNYNQTFGLDKDAISGSRVPNTEETVRLYLYYYNRWCMSLVPTMLCRLMLSSNM